jgi:hypothetical protein
MSDLHITYRFPDLEIRVMGSPGAQSQREGTSGASKDKIHVEHISSDDKKPAFSNQL